MQNALLALPVSVEQIAAVINQMSDGEQQHLLTLTPQLRQVAVSTPVRTKAQIEASVSALQAEVWALLNPRISSPKGKVDHYPHLFCRCK